LCPSHSDFVGEERPWQERISKRQPIIANWSISQSTEDSAGELSPSTAHSNLGAITQNEQDFCSFMTDFANAVNVDDGRTMNAHELGWIEPLHQ